MIHKPLANYTTPQTLFRQLLTSEANSNILLLQGESGCGKSRLIEHCLSNASDALSLLFQLQSGGETIATLLTTLGRTCGWEKLPTFTKTAVTLLEQPPEKTADPLWLQGMHRHLRDVGRIGDIDSRLGRYQLLTDAWFADASQFDTPLLLAVDAYENASTLFDRWFCHDFLHHVAHSAAVKLIVGGQTVPDIQPGLSVLAETLTGIHQPEEWLAWAVAVGFAPPSLADMGLITRILKGNPSQIIEAIYSEFQQATSLTNPMTWSPIQRKQFRKAMIDAFSLPDLRDICFDMGIDYENLPNHTQKSELVRELIADCTRNGRFPDLLQLCQSERPHLEWVSP
ncbi:MAG: ATP-binding protein [Anaerolineales bacterium]|nr:ATP-binding protein [Anaerolineales bacterium]